MHSNTNELRVAVALLGARCHYAVPRILFEHGALSALYTDIHSSDWPARLLSALLKREWLPGAARRLIDRRIDEIPPGLIKSFPSFGLANAWRHSRATTSGNTLLRFAQDNERFCRRVLKNGLGNANSLYVYNGAGLELMQFARRNGIRTIHEQTIAPYNLVEPMLEKERSNWPGWEVCEAKRDDWKVLADRECQEWELADSIICGSTYVVAGIRKSLSCDVSCSVVPYGVTLPSDGVERQEVRSRKLRVLFLGTVELRKGIQYLAQTAEMMKSSEVEFRAVGPIRISEHAFQSASRNIEFAGPVHRSQLMEQLGWADVFVLPTLAEGSAIVVYEALAAGLPVITTANSGSVLRDGIEGFLVPAHDPNAIQVCIESYLSNPELVPQQSRAALARATEFTVPKYGVRLMEIIESLSEAK